MQNRILIVDDNPQNIQLAASTLKHENITLGFAENGFEAIERLKEKSFDLILMDVMMPEMDGFETSRYIKELPGYRQVPIIFLTAKDTDDYVMEGFYSGGVDYITKPFNALELRARVNTHLLLKRQEAENLNLVRELSATYRATIISELMRNIAHHWRQPLAGISLNLTALKTDLLDKECIEQDQIDLIEASNSELVSLSKVITLFSNKVLSSEINRLSLAEMLNNIDFILKSRIEELQASIHYDVPEMLTTSGISEIVFDVLLMLVNNSLDIAEMRNIERPLVKIRMEITETDTVLIVEDNSGGIREEPIDKIFIPYTTTHFESRNKGLSLYTAKHVVVDLLGGELSAQNYEKGARFTMRIPHD